MSMRKAANFAYDLGQKIGQGTCVAIQYTRNGEEIDIEEIRHIVLAATYSDYAL